MDPHEIGYVPQFSIAYDLLTVWESVESALRLRVSGLSAEEQEERLEKILREVGLEDISDREVRVLSGGQKRRLAMALEMVSSPHLLLCDEVTSGLDPKAEDEITKLMHQLSQRDDRIVLSVTHSLRHLALYDSIVVLFQGHLAYHGPAQFALPLLRCGEAGGTFPAARAAQTRATGIARGKSIARPTTRESKLDAAEVAQEVALGGGLEQARAGRRGDGGAFPEAAARRPQTRTTTRRKRRRPCRESEQRRRDDDGGHAGAGRKRARPSFPGTPSALRAIRRAARAAVEDFLSRPRPALAPARAALWLSDSRRRLRARRSAADQKSQWRALGQSLRAGDQFDDADAGTDESGQPGFRADHVPGHPARAHGLEQRGARNRRASG